MRRPSARVASDSQRPARGTICAASAALISAALACSPGTDAGSGVELPPVDAEEMNVVWFIIDDLGWRDLGVTGSRFYDTPNVDRLAAEGTRFSDFYTASPVCSPTRASFMSGKHPARVHITNWIGGEQEGMLLQADYEHQLPLEEVTVGEAFEAAGYATGYIGKWHLGDGEFLPDAQGFDTTVAVNGGGQPTTYFWPYRRQEPSVWDVPDLEDGADTEYLTDRLTDEALAFLDQHRDERFFLVLSHYAVHTPIESKPELTAKYEARAAALPPTPGAEFLLEGTLGTTKQRQDHPVYAGMVESTDDSVGRVLDRLDELDLADSTIIVFVSDNGGLSTLRPGRTSMPTSNAPLRAGKGWLYEGGTRAPLIVKWPGRAEGGRVSAVPATSMDLYPTLLEINGLAQRPDQHQDGMSLARILLGDNDLERREALFWHFPHYHGSGNRPSGAVRDGRFKLIEWFEDGRAELYDLSVDPGETTDLSTQQPRKADELRRLLGSWRVSVNAHMPTANPDWDPSR